MREYLLNSEALLDHRALAYLDDKKKNHSLLPCSWIRFNDRVKLAYFPDGLVTAASRLESMSLDEICEAEGRILKLADRLSQVEEISLENIVWDAESIFLDDKNKVYMICLPSVAPEDSMESQIYKKRIYALMEEMLAGKEGAGEVCRQIDYQKEKFFGEWLSLAEALNRRVPEEDETISLRSVNAPEELVFRIGHDKPVCIGSDESQADGLIAGVETVSPLHAVIGWNEICFYVTDKGSEKGTFVNDQMIAPNTEVPIGKGTVLRFADCTFTVE